MKNTQPIRTLSSARVAPLMVVLLGSWLLVGTALPRATEPVAGAMGSQAADTGKKNRYIGTAKCKTCHDKPETGDQHGVWSSLGHAHAFETPATDKAKETAAAHGVEDAQKSDECRRCHVTAFGVAPEGIQKGFDAELGVQCEACHGPGELHLLARFRAAKQATEAYPDIPADEIVSRPPISTCKTCHNADNPNFVPFCPHERMEAIRHWNPKKPRSETEKQGYPCECEGDCVCKQGSEDATCRSAAK
jgi:hypothetical protein